MQTQPSFDVIGGRYVTTYLDHRPGHMPQVERNVKLAHDHASFDDALAQLADLHYYDFACVTRNGLEFHLHGDAPVNNDTMRLHSGYGHCDWQGNDQWYEVFSIDCPHIEGVESYAGEYLVQYDVDEIPDYDEDCDIEALYLDYKGKRYIVDVTEPMEAAA